MMSGDWGEGMINEVYKNSGLGDWFHKQSAGGKPGWDRYNSKGEKAGKCGDAKEGDPYSACLSKQKAEKLGKDGIASFVRRKRKAQKEAGDKVKGKQNKKGKDPVYVSTESNIQESKPKDWDQYLDNMKKNLKDAGYDLRKPIDRKDAWDVIGSVAVSRLASRGVIDIEGGEGRKSKTSIGEGYATDRMNQISVSLGYKSFKLEVSSSNEEIMSGLSNRSYTSSDSGMFFIMPREEVVSFWMKDCLFDLDLVFLDKSGKVTQIEGARCEPRIEGESNAQYESRLSVYTSHSPTKYVIEVPYGEAFGSGLKVGDVVGLPIIEDENYYPEEYMRVLREKNSKNKKNVPTDQNLWDQSLEKTKNKFDVFPSAYASAYAAKIYKEAGGKWKKT